MVQDKDLSRHTLEAMGDVAAQRVLRSYARRRFAEQLITVWLVATLAGAIAFALTS